ncbi:hypothetical protein B0H66DRAFT_602736 [Apodospora peruviana]|uniref:Uncharacterized protein n=1 Tax=Apodospora peruviana TaxID=516989 RepID=A0AAE0I4J1_9PEZI|nr:hypothetical protein B0H66DRAFT_602736 [Apodospora peruviana]
MVRFSTRSLLAIAATNVVIAQEATLPTNPLTTLTETEGIPPPPPPPPPTPTPSSGGGINTNPTPTVVSGCPAILSTTDICSSCVTPECVILATATASCGCPDPLVTVYRSHPCDLGCAGLGGCKTVWTVESAADRDACGGGSTTVITPTSGGT